MLISIGQFGPRSTTTLNPALDIYFDNVLLLVSTSTPSPTPTGTPTYTPTPIYTNTPTPLYTNTPTATAVASPTSTPSPLRQAKYTYDGDGNLVKSDVTTLDGIETITYYVAGYYNEQVSNGVTKIQKFYSIGSQTVAVQTSLNGGQPTLNWIMTDNLNSTTVTANADGTFNSELRYSAFGEIRYSSGSTPTNYQYTGQLSQQAIGLDFYVARWYDPVTAHFAQADTEVSDPGEPQTFDRYMYVNNNPISNDDPSGHFVDYIGSAFDHYMSTHPDSTPITSDLNQSYKSQIHNYYGVTLAGSWSLDSEDNIYNGLRNMDAKLNGISRYTNGTTYTYSNTSSGFYGGVTNPFTGNIAFHTPGYTVPIQNIYHEIGHSINARSGNYFTESLNANRVYTKGGDYVMGGPVSTYNRNSLGYSAIGYYQSRPKGDSPVWVTYQQHPGNAPCAANAKFCNDGNSSDEEWADLVANYVANNFITDPSKKYSDYGIARENWVSSIWSSSFSSAFKP